MGKSRRKPKVGDYVACRFGDDFFKGQVEETGIETVGGGKDEPVEKIMMFFPDDGKTHGFVIKSDNWKYARSDKAFLEALEDALKTAGKIIEAQKAKPKQASKPVKKKAKLKAKPKDKKKPQPTKAKKLKKKPQRPFGPAGHRRLQPPSQMPPTRTT